MPMFYVVVNIAVLVLYIPFAAAVLVRSRRRKSQVPAGAQLNALSIGFLVVFMLSNLAVCTVENVFAALWP